MQRVMAISYRRLGKLIFWILDPRIWDPIGCPETSVRYYHYLLRDNPEERSSHTLRRGSLKLYRGSCVGNGWAQVLGLLQGPEFGT